MRELELEEISHVSGGCVETTTQPLPDGGTEITGTPCDGDPWATSVTMDTILMSGMTVSEFLFGQSYEPSLGEGETTLLDGMTGGAYSAGEATADVINDAMDLDGEGYMFRDFILSIFGSELPQEIQDSYTNLPPPPQD